MAVARYKALCIDALEPARLAAFWGPVLGLEATEVPTGQKLYGAVPEQDVWVNQVPEPRTVKHRVHLDVHGGRPEDLDGATPVSADGEFPWRVMADPEGGEFCLFTRAEPPAYRLYELAVDAADADAQAAWWHGVLGGRTGRAGRADEGWTWLEDVPRMPFESLVFAPVPEPKTVKNRVHWDVVVADQGGVDELLARGATLLREPDAEISWSILADPEGNEFCAFLD